MHMFSSPCHRCCLMCLTVSGCWMAAFTESTNVCNVATSSVVNLFTNLPQPSSVYVPIGQPRLIFVKQVVNHYDQGQAFCKGYGGTLFAPTTQQDITDLTAQGINGYLGLKRVGGNWVDASGNPYTINPTLMHPSYPNYYGDCARVRDGIGIADCSCDKTRNFVCQI